MNYRSYPSKATTPKRMNRKKERNATFLANSKMRGLLQKQNRELRRGTE